jgi:predicted RNA-binding Zn ribbon-like protein
MSDRSDWLSDVRGRRLPHGSWPPTRTAPDGLETVRQFLNTRNPHTGADILGTVAELRAWLDERHLPAGRITARELHGVHHLRDVLHALTIANSDGGPSNNGWTELAALAALYPVRITFEKSPAVRSLERGCSEFVTGLLDTAARTRHDGTWALLKACRDDTCRWVIYDRSKNRSASWCSAGTCGGKARAKSYRQRKRIE